MMSASDIAPICPRRTIIRFGALVLASATAGCSNFIPSSGPRIDGITKPASQSAGDPGTPSAPNLKYALLTVDAPIVAGLEGDAPGSLFSAGLLSQAAAELRKHPREGFLRQRPIVEQPALLAVQHRLRPHQGSQQLQRRRGAVLGKVQQGDGLGRQARLQ
jgi:hypothetical protein